jgi:hypothetical protein
MQESEFAFLTEMKEGGERKAAKQDRNKRLSDKTTNRAFSAFLQATTFLSKESHLIYLAFSR